MFRLVQNPRMEETVFNEVLRLKSQPVIAVENFDRKEKLPPVLTRTKIKEMVEQLKQSHRLVDVIDDTNRKFCVTLLRYNVDKSEDSCAPV